jgi:hypothetical protein
MVWRASFNLEEVAMEEEWVVEEEVAMEEEWVVEEAEVVKAEAAVEATSDKGLCLLVCKKSTQIIGLSNTSHIIKQNLI